MRRDVRNSHHLATVSHDGRFWDAYLELEEARAHGEPIRGRIAFSAAGEPDADPVRTATIFVEPTPQDVLARARDMKTHHLVALLRSSIPDDAGVESGPDEAPDPSEEDRPSA